MPSPFNKDETDLLTSSIDQAIQSAKRQQKSGKSPQISAVYQQQENTLNALKLKLAGLK